MAEPKPPDKPLLERVGVQYFRRRSQARPPATSGDAVHFINADERRAMKRVELGAVTRSALAGALSGGVAAAAEVIASPRLPAGAALLSRESLTYWAILGGATLVASVLEILFLYWDTLRSVHELARAAGLELFGKDRTSSDSALVDALARAALELPNPILGPHGVNSRRESSKGMLLLASLAYKAKVGVTSFLLKLLVRRVLGRVFVRSAVSTFVPFVAVPVTAAWNGLVTWWVLREARLRAMGPSAVEELVDSAFDATPTLSNEGRLATLRAVAASIVRTQDLHPNLVSLLTEVSERAGDVGRAELDDVGEFLRSLRTLPPVELTLVLRVLAIGCIVDGRFSSRERKLYIDALTAAGKPVDLMPVERLRVAFVRGDGVQHDALRATA